MPNTDIKISTAVSANNPIIGDIYVGPDSGIRLTNSLAEDVQNYLLISLRLFKGEWYLDLTQGIPYFQNILGKKISLQIVTQIFKSAILKCPGIQSLDSIDTRRLEARAIQLVFSVTLQDGKILTSSDFPPFILGGA